QHAEKTLQQLHTRQGRLNQESAGLTPVDTAAITEMLDRQAEMSEMLAMLTEQIEDNQQSLADLTAQRQPLQQRVEQLNRQQHQVAGELAGLRKIQQSLTRDNVTDAWLRQHNLHDAPRLWQTLHIATGWETALEAVLDNRMQAVAADLSMPTATLPASRLALFDNAPAAMPADATTAPRLLDKITLKSPEHHALHDWLAQVYIADNLTIARTMQANLPLGAQLVSSEGHILTRHSVQFYAPNDATQGVLARQNEIERLTQENEEIILQLSITTEQNEVLQAQISQHQHTATALRSQHTQTQQQLHQQQLNLSRRQQEAERVDYRRAQITSELAEIEAQMRHEYEATGQLQAQLATHREQIATLQIQLDDARRARQDA
ncbi:MAG: hypothetical protein ABL868_11795, partial [Sulfuriferula sp.]